MSKVNETGHVNGRLRPFRGSFALGVLLQNEVFEFSRQLFLTLARA